MFPLYDSIKAEKFPITTIFIIALTVFVFIQQIFAPNPDAFTLRYALIPSNIHGDTFAMYVPFFTAIFLHGGFLHILTNMWFLWVFGDNVEESFGKLKYLFLYLAAGVAGNFVQYLLMPTSSIPMLGASGAVAGVLGAYFILFPYAKVKTVIFIFFFFTIIDIAAPIILGYWFILQVLSGITLFQLATGGIAFAAHVTGFLIGVLFAKLLHRPQTEGHIIWSS